MQNEKGIQDKQKEVQQQQTNVTSSKKQHIHFVIESKKVQVNQLNHPLLQKFIEITASQNLDKFSKIKKLKIEGNSFSREVCEYFGTVFSRKENNIQDLDINDIFVSRLKEQIPISIQHMAKGLKQSQLQRLDISNNAVNPYGAKALLHFLQVAKNLRVLQISNCGLGPLGVKQIASGFEGMPNLELLSIGRNRMENEGILYITDSIQHLGQLKQLEIYQNTLRKEGLRPLFEKIRKNNVKMVTFDICDNFVRDEATDEMCNLIKELKFLKNLDLSDCLKEEENEKIVKAFQESPNRSFQRLGFNFIELEAELALRLLEVVKECPMKRLNIVGNQFNKKTKKAYSQAFSGKTYEGRDVLSAFQDDQDDQEQATRLLANVTLQN